MANPETKEASSSVSWLDSQRKEILSQQFESDVLIRSLVTDRAQKRKYYECKDKYLRLQQIPTWREQTKEDEDGCGVMDLFSILRCDITALEVDCIVNAANEGLLGGGGVDEAVHKASGPLLQFECANLPICDPGNSVITKGYLLPASFVIHTVGPYLDQHDEPQPNVLKQCYHSIMELCSEYQLSSIAIPPISTGFYGFPKDAAAAIAVETVAQYLQQNEDRMKHLQRVIFADVSNKGVGAYKKAMNNYLHQKQQNE